MRLFAITCAVLLLGSATWTFAQPSPCAEPYIIPYNNQSLYGGYCVEFCHDNNGIRTICVGPFPAYCPIQYPIIWGVPMFPAEISNCDPCATVDFWSIAPDFYTTWRWDVLDGLTYLCVDMQLYESYPAGSACIFIDVHLGNWGTFDCWLPAELMSFNAVSVANGIEITFATASETDLNYFEIVREHNGNSHVVSQLDAENSATGANYSYLDRDVVFDETYRYYLRTVDLDGSIEEHLDHAITVTYSHPVAIPGAYALRAYPNPFNPTTTLRFDLAVESNVVFRVFNTLGEEVALLQMGTKSAGSHSFTWNAAALPSGMYIGRIEAGTNTAALKLVLMK